MSKAKKSAPAPHAAGNGWSVTNALAEVDRHAVPKTGIVRHLAGVRIAAEGEAVSSKEPRADARVPEDAALLERAGQASEAAWADARVSLIGRALDAEALRLAANPTKAGKVAAHLAPLIEKAFAGALAEAPGERARAIIGRERDSLETEILSERAVLSAAARQKADKESRHAVLVEEIAALTESPQRWHAVSGRRQRMIDDLPLDEPRKRALKSQVAQAQADATAAGLLAQDPAWLLEDLDDPDFAGALGKAGAERWRSEAETAIAHRAERIAAESAERAQLAASDMRATLKRLRDKDDAPLPAAGEVAATLGSDLAAVAALAEVRKGRKRRHAWNAVALMAPADEPAWIDAVPDKETREIRAQAVAAKHAALQTDRGRWLMQHSATLQALGAEAVQDAAKLPRLADYYATLRNRVSGRGRGDAGSTDGAVANDNAKAVQPSPDSRADPAMSSPAANADAPNDGAEPLPDAVAADLVEQVLAGETPQTQLDALTKILDGAAGGDDPKDGSFAANVAPEDRTRAAAIAQQLERFGLPQGTAARWAQFADPRTRRSAKLAMLGAFAKQIANEERILSGEGETSPTELVGDDSDRDTISLGDIETGAFSAQYRFDQLRERVRALVDDGKISEEDGQRFLADPRVEALTESELPPEIAGALASDNKDQIVSALSVAADYILAGAEKLAELEERYGSLAHTVYYGAQALFSGPWKTAINILIDQGVDIAINELAEEYFDDAIFYVARQLDDIFSIKDPEASKIAAAGIFGFITVIGIGLSAGDTFRFARHIAERFQRRRVAAANRLSLEDVPFLRNRPFTRDKMEELIGMRDNETWTTALTRFFEKTRKLSRLPQEDKEALIKFFTVGAYPKTLEKLVDREIGALGETENFVVVNQFWVRLLNGEGGAKPDFLFLDNRLNVADVSHEIDDLLDMVVDGDSMFGEAKAPLRGYTKQQSKVAGRLDEVGREDSFPIFALPQSELPPELLRHSVDAILHWKNFRHIDPELAHIVVDQLRKRFHPRAPAGRLLLTAAALLAAIDATLSTQENEED